MNKTNDKVREQEFTTEKTGHKKHDKIVRYFLRGIGEGYFPRAIAGKLGKVIALCSPHGEEWGIG